MVILLLSSQCRERMGMYFQNIFKIVRYLKCFSGIIIWFLEGRSISHPTWNNAETFAHMCRSGTTRWQDTYISCALMCCWAITQPLVALNLMVHWYERPFINQPDLIRCYFFCKFWTHAKIYFRYIVCEYIYKYKSVYYWYVITCIIW